MHKTLTALLIFSCAGMFQSISLVHANDRAQPLGWVEKASLEPWGAVVKAKLDSGALTSSLQAENIEHFEKGDEDWVRFTVEIEDESRDEEVEQRFERPLYRNLTVQGAGGEEDRPVVLMEICIGKRMLEEQFSLEDRDNMLYPVLLGRRTIQDLGPVDVTKTFTSDPGCDKSTPVLKHADKDYDEDIGA